VIEVEAQLPQDLRTAVRAEIARALHPPFETLLTVAVNGALMSLLWFFLPPSVKDNVFTLHQSLVFGVVLSAWMYSDVPSTNVLGSDATRVLAAIDDPTMLRRLLDAKVVLLWLIITPICLIAALISALSSHTYLAALYSAIWIGVVPFGFLSLAALLGIRWPYHPMPLRARFAQLQPRRQRLWRWLALITLPYVIVPALGVALMAPSLLLWGLGAPNSLSGAIPHDYLGWGVFLACGIAGGSWLLTRRLQDRMILRCRASLVDFLSDPARA
jgi:hypothetical protein